MVRSILVNSVLSALPTYIMSTFLIPVGVIREFDKMWRHFFWNQTLDKRKVHCFSWKNVEQPLLHGGLSVKNLEIQNFTLIGKRRLGDAFRPS